MVRCTSSLSSNMSSAGHLARPPRHPGVLGSAGKGLRKVFPLHTCPPLPGDAGSTALLRVLERCYSFPAVRAMVKEKARGPCVGLPACDMTCRLHDRRVRFLCVKALPCGVMWRTVGGPMFVRAGKDSFCHCCGRFPRPNLSRTVSSFLMFSNILVKTCRKDLVISPRQESSLRRIGWSGAVTCGTQSKRNTPHALARVKPSFPLSKEKESQTSR